MRSWIFSSALTLLLATECLAFKAHDFKICSQSGFCRRGRALAERAKEAQASWKSPYSVDQSSVKISADQAVFTAAVKSSLYPEIHFGLEVRIQDDGVARVRMDEVGGLRKRYDEAASWALIEEPALSKDIKWKVGKRDTRAAYSGVEVVVEHEPLRVSLLRNGKEQIVLNGQGLLHMEHFRKKAEEPTTTDEPAPEPEDAAEGEAAQAPLVKKENPRAWFEGETEDDYWAETFSSWTDSKPKGALCRECHSLICSPTNKESKALNPYLSISTSLTMERCTAFPSTRRSLLCLAQGVTAPNSATPTASTIPMYSSTSPPPLSRSTDPSP